MLVGMWRPAIFVGHPLEAISYSLGAEAGSGIRRSPDDCESAPGGGMACSVAIPDPFSDSSSYTVPYKVTVDRLGCWKATRLQPKPNHEFGAKRLSDCLGVRDYYQPLEAPRRYE